MNSVEHAAIMLGTEIARTIARAWLDVDDPDSDVSIIDLTESRFADRIQVRRFLRGLDDIADAMAERLIRITVEVGLPEQESTAAAYAATETLADAKLSPVYLRAAATNEAGLRRHLMASEAKVLHSSSLGEAAGDLYSRLLAETCGMLAGILALLPDPGTTDTLLTRIARVQAQVDTVLARISPKIGELQGFENAYRRHVESSLDRIEIYGVDLPEPMRSFPLSETYTPRRVSTNGLRVDSELLVADQRRILLVGDAGSGKTTLMKWLAVAAARQSHTGKLMPLNDVLPFYVPVRGLVVNPASPTLETLLEPAATLLASDAPPGLVHAYFESGRAMVLIDGIDEVNPVDRSRIHDWLSDIIAAYPEARYFVTSRPAAVSDDWLQNLGFAKAELLPLDRTGMATLIQRWFRAALGERNQPENAAEQARRLLSQLDENANLNSLGGNPLLCALICVTFFSYSRVPESSCELYSMFLDKLLDRRDYQRWVVHGTEISRSEKMVVLQKLAWWMVSNEQTETDTQTALSLISTKQLRLLADSPRDPRAIYQLLLERSGLLRESAPGRVQFIHRTFQEFLAAREAAESDQIESLVSLAHEDRWRDVVALTSYYCNVRQVDRLISGLIERGRNDPGQRLVLLRTAEKCLSNATSVAPDLRADLADAVRQLESRPTADSASQDALNQMADSLLDIPCMREPGGERAIIQLLPSTARDRIRYSAVSRVQVMAILRECLRYDGGLRDLVSAIRALEGDTPAAARLEDAVVKLTPHLTPGKRF